MQVLYGIWLTKFIEFNCFVRENFHSFFFVGPEMKN